MVCAALAAVRWPGRRPAPGGGRPHPRSATPRPPSTCSCEPGRRRWAWSTRPVVRELDRRVQELFVRVRARHRRTRGGRGAPRSHRAPRPRRRARGDARARGPRARGPAAADAPDPRELAVVHRDASTPPTCSAPWSRSRTSRRLASSGGAADELELLRRRVIAALVDAARHSRPQPGRLPAGPAGRALPRAGDRVARRHPRGPGALGRRAPRAEPHRRASGAASTVRSRSRLEPRAVLLEIVRDDDGRWRPWIKACAVDAARSIAPADLDLLGEVAGPRRRAVA